MFGDHGLGGLLKEGAHGKSPKCLDGNLGDFGEILQRSLFALFFVLLASYPNDVYVQHIFMICEKSIQNTCI